jgi:hypothetical protein
MVGSIRGFALLEEKENPDVKRGAGFKHFWMVLQKWLTLRVGYIFNYEVRHANFLFGTIGLYGKRTLLVTPPHDGY